MGFFIGLRIIERFYYKKLAVEYREARYKPALYYMYPDT